MTLEEAKVQYKRALSSLLYSCGLGDLSAIEDSVKTLDAAVCDFGLAVTELQGWDRKHDTYRSKGWMRAEINRLFDAKRRP